MSDLWTDENVEKLKKLWAEEVSCSQIAKELGCTRNAVIGKAGRMKLKKRDQAVAHRHWQATNLERYGSKNGRKAGAARRREAKNPASHAWRWNTSGPKPGRQIEEPVNIVGAYSLADLPPRGCKWPLGDPRSEAFGFCGAPRDGDGPYCVGHSQIAYDRPAKTANEMTRSLRKAAA